MTDVVEPSSIAPSRPFVARLKSIGLSFGKTRALDRIDLVVPSGLTVGLIGPDGVGKSSLLALIAGVQSIQEGRIEVLGGDMADASHRADTCPRIAYMPQGLGKNLYPTLSVYENIDFFGRLFGHDLDERRRRITDLMRATGLAPFADRQAGKLSGGMKQKLGLCCSLIHDPDLLILDEPTTGVDPLSRRQFWELIDEIRRNRTGMSVIVATAYMEEALRFDHLIAMDDGRVLAEGTPTVLMERTDTIDLDAAFIALLPEDKRSDHRKIVIPPRGDGDGEIVIEAEHLTMRFGDFTAVDDVDFRIRRGEIFGFLGSNGCGKTTTMKMLTGLLSASEGSASLFGRPVDPDDIEVRRRVGYMSQAFSLYSELTVRQNLELHARLFRMASRDIPARILEVVKRFDLEDVMEVLPDTLALGHRQRLSLAVSMIHGPDILILDEPTSGVDPVARDRFWQILSDLSRNDGVTIFVSTHFMNEAALCDRISLMHAGKVLVSAAPAAIVATRGKATLEEAFISHLEDATEATGQASPAVAEGAVSEAGGSPRQPHRRHRAFDFGRLFAYSHRESLELRRDPIRATLALLGSVMLMVVVGYGITLDVEKLAFAVLDRDDTTLSRSYVQEISGSRYFVEKAPITDYDDLDRRMRSGELSLAIEIPTGFARDLERRRRTVEIGAWIDGAMPTRAETVIGYVQGVHNSWLKQRAREMLGDAAVQGNFQLELRYRYNPGIESVVAMVPAIIPLLLMLIPAMLAVLSVVREKELGSIINFYATPVTRFEFLIGKQAPYVALAMLNFAMLWAVAHFLFGVPVKGSALTLTLAAFFYVVIATGMGLVISTFMKSQISAIFGTALITLIPAIEYSGMIDPVSSLQGVGAIVGQIYPTAHFITIARGTFSKALGFSDLTESLWFLLLTIPILTGLGTTLLKKQAG